MKSLWHGTYSAAEASALLPEPSLGMMALPHVGMYLVAGYERS